MKAEQDKTGGNARHPEAPEVQTALELLHTTQDVPAAPDFKTPDHCTTVMSTHEVVPCLKYYIYWLIELWMPQVLIS